MSRRTVAKAMAWSVPAIALAAPLPSAAASVRGLDITRFDRFCRGSVVAASFEVRNLGSTPVQVNQANLSVNNVPLTVTQVNFGAFTTLPATIDPGATVTVVVYANTPSIQNGQTYTVTLELLYSESGTAGSDTFVTGPLKFTGQDQCAYPA